MSGILFIAQSAYPLGGVATWLDYLVRGMEELGWDVTVALAKGKLCNPEKYLELHPFKKTLEIENRTGTREGAVRGVCGVLKTGDFDVVVSDLPDVYAAAERVRTAGSAHFKVVASLHALWPDYYDDVKTYRHVIDGVVCSNKLACALAENVSGTESGRVHYAPYGVPLSRRSGNGIHGPLRIACVGRIEERQKRISDIPKVLEKLEENNFDYELKVFGDGPDAMQLRRALDAAGISKKARFIGHIPYARVNEEIYRKSDVLLVTSFWETGPIVMWEAMANGAAVVSSRYVGSGMEGSLRHEDNCLLFPAGDAQAAAAQIMRLKDRGLAEKLTRNAYELIARKYSQELSVGSWADAFKKILSLPPLPAPRHRTKIRSRPGLDWIFGASRAEDIREAFDLRSSCKEVWSEWPHAYSRKHCFDPYFWEKAKELDSSL